MTTEEAIKHSVISEAARTLCCDPILSKRFSVNTPQLGTVFAAFVAFDCSTVLSTCLAFGIGTRSVGHSAPFDSQWQERRLLCVEDGHAEVMARRALRVYILQEIEGQLRNVCPSQTAHRTEPRLTSPLVWNDDLHAFSWRDEMQLYLVVTQTPCGSLAVLNDELSEFSTGAHPLLATPSLPAADAISSLPLQARTVQHNGHTLGRIHDPFSHLADVRRTKPGAGIPSLCMSCSDKIERWQALGLQGAMLRDAILPEPLTCRGVFIADPTPMFRSKLASLGASSDEVDNKAQTLRVVSLERARRWAQRTQTNRIEFYDLAAYFAPNDLSSSCNSVAGWLERAHSSKRGRDDIEVESCERFDTVIEEFNSKDGIRLGATRSTIDNLLESLKSASHRHGLIFRQLVDSLQQLKVPSCQNSEFVNNDSSASDSDLCDRISSDAQALLNIIPTRCCFHISRLWCMLKVLHVTKGRIRKTCDAASQSKSSSAVALFLRFFQKSSKRTDGLKLLGSEGLLWVDKTAN